MRGIPDCLARISAQTAWTDLRSWRCTRLNCCGPMIASISIPGVTRTLAVLKSGLRKYLYLLTVTGPGSCDDILIFDPFESRTLDVQTLTRQFIPASRAVIKSVTVVGPPNPYAGLKYGRTCRTCGTWEFPGRVWVSLFIMGKHASRLQVWTPANEVVPSGRAGCNKITSNSPVQVSSSLLTP